MTSPAPPQVVHDTLGARKRARPTLLDVGNPDFPDNTPSDTLQDPTVAVREPHLYDSPVMVTHEPELDPPPRSASSSSSLDPYYFTAHTPDLPQLTLNPIQPAPRTPEMRRHVTEPITPARDPASIDRRGLVGVGELATPRWTRAPRVDDDDEDQVDLTLNNPDGDYEQDDPDSPWTIEARDGETENMDHPDMADAPRLPRSLRARPSMADESGGEEILYPRQSEQSEQRHLQHIPVCELEQASSSDSPRIASREDPIQPLTKDSAVRKHRSLGVGPPPGQKARDRRRDPNPTPSKEAGGLKNDRHSRHPSVGSSSSHDHSRRIHTTDFSHLPPSPSTSSIHHLLKGTGNTVHSPSSVAQSLLRGTQEGWSGMDDEATIDALRKLDGLSSKSAHASSRVSTGGASRANSLSRPGTPAKPTGSHWEGVDGKRASRRISTRVESGSEGKRDSGSGSRNRTGEPPTEGSELHVVAVTSDDVGGPVPSERVARKTSARLSYNAKRTSTSSASHTSPTTSSRDSVSLSATTSATSVSTASGRFPGGKSKRNSTDVHSAGESASDKERAGSGQDSILEHSVPPVPPLPKGLSTYRSPPQSSSTSIHPQQDHHESAVGDEDADRTFSIDFPPARTPSKSTHHLGGQDLPTGGYLVPGSAPAIMKTPSKKWSFTNAFKLAASPTSSSHKDKHSGSPLSATTAQVRKSLSKDRPLTNATSGAWPPVQPDAMASATSLASLSSVGSPAHASAMSSHVVEDRAAESDHPNRVESYASARTNTTALPPPAPLSPTSSVHQGTTSSKRLTPSSIPFFRRSSSQSIHFPSSAVPNSTSPTTSSASYSGTRAGLTKSGSSPSTELPSTSSLSTPSTNRKSSMLSLGIPSLLNGSSSRKSLHGGDKSDTGRDSDRDLNRSKQKEKEKAERSKLKKEEKERSESRISVLMGRKRGKTLSSTDPKKAKPVSLPPMQVAAIPPSTANRVAGLKSSSNSTLPSTSSTPRSSITSRATSHTASSMQKQSDTSLRRHQLPTIAGSPSVGTVGHTSSKEGPPSSSNNASSALSKETPTKIPRIASRSSTVTSPTLKSRRTSAHVNETTPSSESPTASHEFFNEFGILETPPTNAKPPSSRHSTRASPSTTGSVSRVPRQSTTSSSNLMASVTRKANRESLSLAGLRKTSTSSVTSFNVPAETSASHHRFSALSPSKGLKLLSPKVSLSAARLPSSSAAQSHRHVVTSPNSSQQSLLTPSSSPSTVVDEDEIVGDEEMLQYIKRQQAKRLAHGATQEELDELLRFPEPLPPTPLLSPTAVLKSPQAQYLSPYEKKEIFDYQAVYFIGSRSEKKQATPENTTNNYGYDDERGDYQVVSHDHLAFRYEVTDTLGKGSFGQVLSCRDHCTGQSVAVKIIRNKKRFHHQALVEIKILDNLRKWDPDDKHNVIKMTEHFYFRGHLCIAMELLSINLYELIKANGFVGFTTSLIRRFTSQMLMSLSLMRHHRIVHCDLKPENVLLKHPAKSAIKVIDFGSSCLEHEKMYTYIQSRFYRSPEVILGMSYHMAIDMWSLGCIMAELYTGFPIFPGENEQEQLSCIMEILGVPDKEFINRSSRKRLFFDSTGAPRPVVNSKGRRRRPGTKSLAQVLRTDDHLFVDFIAKCLVWDPERRIKPQAALRHEFITSGRRPRITSPSPSISKPLSLPSSSKQKGGETPKKSQISAPTPLTARSSRTAVPTTPSTLSSLTLSTSRSHRTSQQQSYSGYYSARTMNSLTSTAKTT